jgi:hypothetical protein
MGAARFIGAEQVRWQILLLEDLHGLQVGKLDIAGILQNQRFGAITDHNPFAMLDQKCRHVFPPQNYANNLKQMHLQGFALDQTRQGLISSSNPRAHGLVSLCRRATGGR